MYRWMSESSTERLGSFAWYVFSSLRPLHGQPNKKSDDTVGGLILHIYSKPLDAAADSKVFMP